MKKFFFPKYLILISLFISLLVYISSKRPIIGMYGLVEPISDYKNYTKEMIDGRFVHWMESSGAEIVVIHIWYSQEELISLLSQINGVIFSAGPRRPLKYDEPWELNARFVFEYAKNNSIPIWGTCLGMQMITVFMSQDNNLMEEYDNIGLRKVELTELAPQSKIFSLLKKNDIENFSTLSSTYHIHRHGIPPLGFEKNKLLVENYDVVGYGYDTNNKKFVNVIESKKNKEHKIFGAQFHAEVNPYERGLKFKEENPMDALRRSQLISMRFVEEARNNRNQFKSYQERKKYTFISTYFKNKEGEYDRKRNVYYFTKKDI